MPVFMTYKRWRLREGATFPAVADVVRVQIAPHYRRLDPTAELGLEQIVGANAVLATQRWTDRERYDRMTAGPAFERWWASYLPVLERWDRLVQFEDEWETCQLV